MSESVVALSLSVSVALQSHNFLKSIINYQGQFNSSLTFAVRKERLIVTTLRLMEKDW